MSNAVGTLIPNIQSTIERKRKAIQAGKIVQVGEASFLISKTKLNEPAFKNWRLENRIQIEAKLIFPYSDLSRLYQMIDDEYYRVTFPDRRQAVFFKLAYDVVK